MNDNLVKFMTAKWRKKWRPSKVGTQPSFIWVHGKDKIEMGARIRYRQWDIGALGCTPPRYWHGRWETGVIDGIGPDGYLFIEMM